MLTTYTDPFETASYPVFTYLAHSVFKANKQAGEFKC